MHFIRARILDKLVGIRARKPNGGPKPIRLWWFDTRPTDIGIQQTTNSEGVIAQCLRIEAEPRATGKKAVIRIQFQFSRRYLRALPISRGSQHQLQHLLDIPLGGDEFGGEPIQQLRMHRRYALRAKVLGGFHDARAEHVLPEPVNRHSRRERMLR